MAEIPDYLAYAASLKIDGPFLNDAERWQTALTHFFAGLGEVFKAQTGVTVGHIKGFLRLPGGDYAYLSTVGTAAGASCRYFKGERTSGPASVTETGAPAENDDGHGIAVLDFNIIVFGMAEDQVLELLQPAVNRLAEALEADIQLAKAVPKKTGGFKKK